MLMELWTDLREARQGRGNFGAGYDWIYMAYIASGKNDGVFDNDELKKIISPRDRLGRQLTMIVYEYMFDDSENRRAPRLSLEWQHWRDEDAKGYFCSKARLVPQLLHFIVFHNHKVPPVCQRLLYE